MIQVRLAAPRRAARVTVLVLGAAVLRAMLLPAGDVVSTATFGACLLTISWMERGDPLPRPSAARAEGDSRGFIIWTVLAGLATGAVLLVPVMLSPLSGRPLEGFWIWASMAAVIATLEETAIRGALYRRWSEEAGPVVAIGAGALVFALIHLPRYGHGAMPLDAAVGLALGGLRALTGRVLPCAVAHTIADWGAWFWA